MFDSYPSKVRRKLLSVRSLIFSTAAAIEGVGAIEESLKWNEPAYLTAASRSGSTVRLGWKRSAPNDCAIYFNCNTTLVDTFRSLFPTGLRFVGNRAIVFDVSDRVPVKELSFCIAMAMTYRRDRLKGANTSRG